MTNRFKDIKEPFQKHGLNLPALTSLKADANSYEVIAIQPSGVVALDGLAVRSSDRAIAVKKFEQFFELAVQKRCDLVLAPEYSCPWEALEFGIRQHQKLPGQGHLWILGCESTTPAALETFTAKFPDIVWIKEPPQHGHGEFYGVLCYVLRTEATSGHTKDVILLQFKSQPMADSKEFELKHLIRGEVTYVLRNADDQIRLVSLICSESLEFREKAFSHCLLNEKPFVVFHPQLNSDPLHVDFRGYRSDLFAKAYSTTAKRS